VIPLFRKCTTHENTTLFSKEDVAPQVQTQDVSDASPAIYNRPCFSTGMTTGNTVDPAIPIVTDRTCKPLAEICDDFE
jgi:hypothetical protein